MRQAPTGSLGPVGAARSSTTRSTPYRRCVMSSTARPAWRREPGADLGPVAGWHLGQTGRAALVNQPGRRLQVQAGGEQPLDDHVVQVTEDAFAVLHDDEQLP